MFTNIYKVTSPTVIEKFVDNVELETDKVVVKVDYMAICKADIRYFLGARDKNVLEHKYPLAPIHEAVGHVIKDPTNTFKKGDKVILIPNSTTKENLSRDINYRCARPDLGSNYALNATFRSSTTDGFLRQYYTCFPSLLVKYNDKISGEIAVFSELLSVSNAALRRIDFAKVKKLALFGDGIMGYVVYVMLVNKYNDLDITVFGTMEEKLKMFKKAKTKLVSEPCNEWFDTLIECVGGQYSENAINNMINIASVGADLILMGVSESKIPLNTRLILEKGLTIKGVTRSNREDFETVASLFNNEEFVNDVKPLVLSVNNINSLNDIYKCFYDDINNKTVIGKNIMTW